MALALGLEAAGHRVTVAAPGNLRALVGRAGVRFFPLDVEFAALSDRPELTSGNARLRGRRPTPTSRSGPASSASDFGRRTGSDAPLRAIEKRLSRGVRDGDAQPS